MAVSQQTEARTDFWDVQAIKKLLYTYCRSMDRIDVELGYSIWHEGAQADYSEGIYQGSGRGFIDWVLQRHREISAHSHQVTNIFIELDGDRAASEAYVTAVVQAPAEGGVTQTHFCGRYLDRWSYRGGRWGIDRRIYIQDTVELHTFVPGVVPPRMKRDRTDPSYRVLGLVD
jgi:hypothetical protein